MVWSASTKHKTKNSTTTSLNNYAQRKRCFLSKTLDCFFSFPLAGSCQYYSIYKVFFFFFEKVVFTKLKWEIKYLQVTVTNGPVSIIEKGPAHSSAMGTHWGWCFFFSVCRFLWSWKEWWCDETNCTDLLWTSLLFK